MKNMLSYSKFSLQTNIMRQSVSQMKLSFSTSTSFLHKKGNEKYLKRRAAAALDPDQSNIPIIQYASDKPLQKTRLYMFGNAEFGQLGQQGFFQPMKKNQNTLKLMHKPFRTTFGEHEDIRTLSCGYGFTVLSTHSSKNRVCGTGFNQDGQIGYHERTRDKPLGILITPTNIELPTPPGVHIKAVSCGRAHTLLLGSDGQLTTLGNNAYGQAGRRIIEGEDYFRNRMINQIKLDHTIKDIVAGQDHSICITEAGRVMSAGWGADGQTGLGHYNNCSEFTLLEGDIKNERISKVSCFGDCVLAINDEGELFGWGNSEYGQFGSVTDEQQINTPTHLPLGIGKIKDIASGGTVCLALNEAGEVYVWGFGILGKGPKLNLTSKPELLPGTLFGCNQFTQDSTVTRVFAGLGHQAALTSTGDLYIWGKNRNGCLGLGDHKLDQFFPIKVAVAGRVKEVALGVDHSAVLATPWSRH